MFMKYCKITLNWDWRMSTPIIPSSEHLHKEQPDMKCRTSGLSIVCFSPFRGISIWSGGLIWFRTKKVVTLHFLFFQKWQNETVSPFREHCPWIWGLPSWAIRSAIVRIFVRPSFIVFWTWILTRGERFRFNYLLMWHMLKGAHIIFLTWNGSEQGCCCKHTHN